MKKIIVLSSLSVALLAGCSDNIKVETSTLNEKQSDKTVKTDGHEVAHNPQTVDSETSNKSNLNLDDVIPKPVTTFQLGQVAVQEFKPELDPQIIRNLKFSIQSKPESSALTDQSILVSDHHVSIKPDVAGKYVLIMKDASNSYGTVWGTLEFAVEDVKKGIANRYFQAVRVNQLANLAKVV